MFRAEGCLDLGRRGAGGFALGFRAQAEDQIAAQQQLHGLFRRKGDGWQMIARRQPVAFTRERRYRYTRLAERIDIAIDGADRAFAIIREIEGPHRPFFAQAS